MAKNKIQEGKILYLAVASGVVSGDPVLVGSIHGVALIDRDTAGKATIDTAGVYDLSVKAVDDAGNSPVAVGDHIYYVDGDTPKLSKKSSGNFFGYALEVVTTGSTSTINVLVIQGPGPGTADILAGAVGTAELAALAVTTAKIAADAVTTAKIVDANVTAAKLAADAVETAKIKDLNVTEGKIAAGAVTKTKLAAGFIKAAVVAGGAAGDHVVAAMAVGDSLILVGQLDINAGNVVNLVDLTAECTVAAGKFTNVGGTDTTGDVLLVLYLDLT